MTVPTLMVGDMMLRSVQDTAHKRADSLGTMADSTTSMPQPEMRTPQNKGYLEAAYVAISIVYVSYVVILVRRWSALRARQSPN